MKNTRIFIALCMFAAVAACNKPELDDTREAYGSLEVSMAVDGQTKAFSEEDLYNSAIVNIYMDDFTGLVRSYPYTDIPSPFYLHVGQYRADVLAGEWVAANPAPASWENKSYKGSQSFEIFENQTQRVEVVAYVNNAVTNIAFDTTVAENFNPGYTFTIGLDESNSATQLVYTADKSGADGYFIVSGLVLPSFKWTFTGTLAKDGSTFTKSGVIEEIEAAKRYKMNLRYTIKDGDLDFTLLVDKTTENKNDIITFEPVSTGLAASSPFEIWAKHATVHADVDAETAEGATIKFQYVSADGQSTGTVDAVADPASEGSYKADLTGLVANTKYTYMLIINDEQVGDPLEFTTEDDSNLPNSEFKYMSKVSGESYFKFYDPSCGVAEGQNMFWGSGNGLGSEGPSDEEGSGSMGIIITKQAEDRNGDSNDYSVLCETSEMAGFLAAGNLFTGRFVGLVGTSGGKVNFGRPWTTRPTALEVWCKYETDLIDIIKYQPAGVNLTKSDYDRAQVKVALGTWNYKTYGGTAESPVHVNTTDQKTFRDFYTDPSTIAAGDLIIYNDGYALNQGNKALNQVNKVSATTSGWVKYRIDLDYRNLNEYPTHIIVSFAASQYGDYFTGNAGSKLWVDDVRLIYE